MDVENDEDAPRSKGEGGVVLLLVSKVGGNNKKKKKRFGGLLLGANVKKGSRCTLATPEPAYRVTHGPCRPPVWPRVWG